MAPSAFSKLFCNCYWLSATIFVAFWERIDQSLCRQSLIGSLVARTTLTIYSVQLLVVISDLVLGCSHSHDACYRLVNGLL